MFPASSVRSCLNAHQGATQVQSGRSRPGGSFKSFLSSLNTNKSNTGPQRPSSSPSAHRKWGWSKFPTGKASELKANPSWLGHYHDHHTNTRNKAPVSTGTHRDGCRPQSLPQTPVSCVLQTYQGVFTPPCTYSTSFLTRLVKSPIQSPG